MAAPGDRSGPTLSAGRYVVERKLGEGGHAAVYRVYDRRLGVRRAVKMMLSDAASRPRLRARFEQEAHTMAALDHPHVVPVYDVVTDGPIPYMVMELLTGGSLAGWLELYGPMPPGMAASCVRQVGLGLVAVHQRGVVHRDVKPHNVLVSSTGVCKLTDFGIARVGDLGHTRTGVSMGTQGYMAPEQARDASTVDVRVDVFSLGMTLFVLATCRDPLERLAGRGLDSLPEALRSLVDRATAFERSRRPRDVPALLVELDEAVKTLPPDPPSPSLALPEDDSEDRGLDELHTECDDDRKTTDTGSLLAPVLLPYLVPTPVAVPSDVTPDWVDRSEDTATPVGFEVTLEGLSPLPLAPELRPPASGVDDPLRPGREADPQGGFVRELTQFLLGSLVDPWRVVPPVLLLALLLIAVPALRTTDVDAVAREVQQARAALDAAALDPDGLGATMAVAGDPDALRELHAEWQATEGEPARTLALERYLDGMEHEVRQYGIRGVPATDRARQAIARLRARLAEYEAKLAEHEARRSSTSGCLALELSP